MKKTKKVFIMVCFMVVILANPVFAAANKNKNDSEAKAAVVNGEVITKGDLDREVNRFVQRYANQGKQITPEQKKEVKKEILKNMINRKLLYNESIKQGIKIDKKTVDDKFEQLKAGFPSKAEYEKMLKEMDVTEKEIKSSINENLTVQELIDKKITPSVVITDKDAKAFYDAHPEYFKKGEQVKASHILIKSNPLGKEEDKVKARKKIREILDKVKKGEDFAELAKKYSEGPSGARGGDLGYFGRGAMVKPFEEAAFKLKPGEVSDIVVTKFGYHIIKVFDKKPASTISYQEVKPKITNFMKREKIRDKVNNHIEKLRKAAKIKTFI